MKFHEADVLIVGNGILGYSIAFALLQENASTRIVLIGPSTKTACASIAAGAMLNSFAELEDDSLAHEPGRAKFEMNRSAAGLWPAWVDRINKELGHDRVSINQGTYVLQNASADGMDDQNFKAILQGLRDYNEPFEEVDPTSIRGLKPAAQSRPLRALYIPKEGAIPSGILIQALEECLRKNPRLVYLDDDVTQITVGDNGVKEALTGAGHTARAQQVVLCTGARTQELIERMPVLKSRIPRMFHGVGVAIVLKTSVQTPEKVVRTPNRGMACGVHVVPYDRNLCYVGATNMLRPEGERNPRMTSLYGLMHAAMNQINTLYFEAEIERVAVGSRPTTIDTFPLLGETSVPGLWLVTGTRREGLHLSPFLGKSMAQALAGQQSTLPKMFLPERKPIWTLTREEGIKKAVQHLKSSAYQHDLQLPNNGWEAMIDHMLQKEVETLYELCGIRDYGIPPETLGLYQMGIMRA
jgi:glycine oxidase